MIYSECYFCNGNILVKDEHYIECLLCKTKYSYMLIHNGCSHISEYSAVPTVYKYGNVKTDKVHIVLVNNKSTICS
jgi:hypothetical protein